MLNYDTVIFDLDGTLTNSGEGITRSVAFALESMGLPLLDDATVRKFIGPPLSESFRRYCGMTEEQTAQAVSFYKQRYNTVGWLENGVYPGIRSLLHALRKQGARVFVATGKAQQSSERILEHFGLSAFIDRLAGPLSRDDDARKETLIARVMAGEACGRTVMVGDRASDAEGAKKAGVDSIGVAYGYGAEDEFEGLSCPVAESVEALSRMLLGETPVKKGCFITIEGLDGCGKTTQANAIEKALISRGYTVRRTREPGGCAISEKIRDLLLDVSNTGMSGVTEALLYAASRAQHVRQVILPAIGRGEVVLCDRFVDSSVAFQGGGRQLGVPLIQQINAPAIEGCAPDVTVFLKIDHETALRRRGRASVLDRIESEAASFHARVEAAYDEIVSKEPERFIIVDAAQSPQAVSEQILTALTKRLDGAEVF